MALELTIALAFTAGIVSFLSPCILPLIPAFLAYLSGTTLNESKENNKPKKAIITNTMLFVLGFTVIFALVGVLLNGLLIHSSYIIKKWLGYIGGIIIILFGVMLTGLIKVPFLMAEHKIKVKKFKFQYLTSFVFGAAFAVGWTPCVSLVLGSILTLAITQPGSSFALLFAYALGLAIPFLITGIFAAQASNWIAKLSGKLKWISIIFGIILIILGILVFTNNLSKVANLFFVQNLLR